MRIIGIDPGLSGGIAILDDLKIFDKISLYELLYRAEATFKEFKEDLPSFSFLKCEGIQGIIGEDDTEAFYFSDEEDDTRPPPPLVVLKSLPMYQPRPKGPKRKIEDIKIEKPVDPEDPENHAVPDLVP